MLKFKNIVHLSINCLSWLQNVKVKKRAVRIALVKFSFINARIVLQWKCRKMKKKNEKDKPQVLEQNKTSSTRPIKEKMGFLIKLRNLLEAKTCNRIGFGLRNITKLSIDLTSILVSSIRHLSSATCDCHQGSSHAQGIKIRWSRKP